MPTSTWVIVVGSWLLLAALTFLTGRGSGGEGS